MLQPLYDSLMVSHLIKDEWRSSKVVSGAVYVTMTGMSEMPAWYVESLDILQDLHSAVPTMEKTVDQYGWTQCPAEVQRTLLKTVDTKVGEYILVSILRMQVLYAIMLAP